MEITQILIDCSDDFRMTMIRQKRNSEDFYRLFLNNYIPELRRFESLGPGEDWWNESPGILGFESVFSNSTAS